MIAGDVGGNFGTRNWTYPEYAITLWAARRSGPAGQMDRDEERVLPVRLPGARPRYRRGAGPRRGREISSRLRSSLISNVGGYTVAFVPITKSSELAPTVYVFPAAHVRARAVVSNTASTAPYRSAGRPEAILAMERLVDLAAREHGFDPVELRRRNLIPATAMPYRTALGLTYDSGDYVAVDGARAPARRLGRVPGTRREEALQRGRLARHRACELHRNHQRFSGRTGRNRGATGGRGRCHDRNAVERAGARDRLRPMRRRLAGRSLRQRPASHRRHRCGSRKAAGRIPRARCGWRGS